MKNKLTVFSSKVLPPRDDIGVEFTGRNLTKFGGIRLLRKFLIRFGVKEELESAVPIEKRESGKGKTKETMEESPSMARFILITGKQRKALEFQAIGGGKNACFP